MITLGVEDVAKAANFYEKGLGFPRHAFDSPNVAFFSLNGTWLGLFGKEALAEDAAVAFTESSFKAVSLSHCLESEDAVDACFAEAVAAGAIATKQPEKVFWGGYSGYFTDPDGHLWEIAHNPFMKIGPQAE